MAVYSFLGDIILIDSGSITGSLEGTASYALVAEYALNGGGGSGSSITGNEYNTVTFNSLGELEETTTIQIINNNVIISNSLDVGSGSFDKLQLKNNLDENVTFKIKNDISNSYNIIINTIDATTTEGTTLVRNDVGEFIFDEISNYVSISLPDGNYGDVFVSGSGSIITLNNGVVSNTNIQNNAITTAKILAGAVTIEKLGATGAGAGKILTTQDGIAMSWDNIPTSSISDGNKGDITVSGSGNIFTLNDNIVSTSKLVDGSITLSKMSTINSGSGKFLTNTGVDMSWETINIDDVSITAFQLAELDSILYS